MKMKKIFSGLAIAALAMGGFFYAGISSSHPQFTDAELSNIDALTASGESSITLPCAPGGYMCFFIGRDANGTYGCYRIPDMTRV